MALTINCKSQVTATSDLGSYDPDTHINGTYYKDLNNELLPYLGDWEGTTNNKKYIFTFVKFVQVPHRYNGTSTYYYQDELAVKLKVIDLTTNTVLFDQTNVTMYSDFKIISVNKAVRGLFDFIFKDTANCSNRIRFSLLTLPTVPQQVKYCDVEYLDFKQNGCPYTSQDLIPSFLPTTDFVLTKI